MADQATNRFATGIGLASMICGYEELKLRNVATYRQAAAAQLASLSRPVGVGDRR